MACGVPSLNRIMLCSLQQTSLDSGTDVGQLDAPVPNVVTEFHPENRIAQVITICQSERRLLG